MDQQKNIPRSYKTLKLHKIYFLSMKFDINEI